MAGAKKYTVFFDFDNTITTLDVIDDMLLRFSRDHRWIKLEEEWLKGRIGSRECLLGQMQGMRISRQALDKYLAKIKLDPYFKKLKTFLDARKIKAIVLSDNFDYILKRILKNNGIQNLKIFSNRLGFKQDRFSLRFPYTDKHCAKCAHCKKNNLLTNAAGDSIIIYVGDGFSDACPAEYADLAFAKGDLLRHFRSKKLSCLAYKNLSDVYGYFRRVLA